MKALKFENGDTMPNLGLGTWLSDKGEVHDAVLEAIKIGYRHIDCAHIYKNEQEIGEALAKAFKDGLVKREEMWITSKLWNNAHKKEKVWPAFETSLEHLQLDYLDLYLIHWPLVLEDDVEFPTKGSDFVPLSEVPLIETWETLETIHQKGLARHIGVSNFNSNHLNELLQKAKTKPELNQIELHPFLPQNKLTRFCKDNGILLTAYGPLGAAYRIKMEGLDLPVLMEAEAVKDLAEKHQATPAQIVLRWGIQKGFAVIPKSTNPKRIKENFGAWSLQLDEEDMAKLDQLEGPYRFTTGNVWTPEDGPYKQEDLWE
ncbi:aldo/keto reductase [Pararhodonellum marinum]|uniref:aldo/keto reductase n=1 Tax=Pararhodonellum marinum TaxID=2755358 RepID=UPI00188DCE20|nr:aldo/keto reductase [Pararhodonellum marinum]